MTAAFRDFTNELGNPIKVAVIVNNSIGKVATVMKGPDSRTCNLMTRREAEELHAALTEALTVRQTLPHTAILRVKSESAP